MRHMLRAVVVATLFGLSANPGRAADLGFVPGPVVPDEGVPCIFEDWGPVISLPWPSVWLGHFAGGHFVQTAYGSVLDWKDEKVCFPSRASCNRWIGANRRAFHHPEGDWTCLPIR